MIRSNINAQCRSFCKYRDEHDKWTESSATPESSTGDTRVYLAPVFIPFNFSPIHAGRYNALVLNLEIPGSLFAIEVPNDPSPHKHR